MQISRGCTPPYLFTGISNLLQPAQAEVVLGQRSMYLASWSRKDCSVIVYLSKHAGSTVVHNFNLQQQEALHTCITCVIYTCSIGFCPLYIFIIVGLLYYMREFHIIYFQRIYVRSRMLIRISIFCIFITCIIGCIFILSKDRYQFRTPPLET